ncbi:patatin-like phospholipase family protein [archaeon]|nr:patatin-like phospholipase family protein [archaeon]
MKKDIILCLGGGAMTGIFGMGVVSVLEEMNLYPRIRAVYGSSAGVPNGAYFLTKQSKLGSSVYLKDLTHNFIFPINYFINVWKKYKYGFNKKIDDSIDINYAMKVMRYKKPLNVNKLKNSKIPLYAKLININTLKVEYVDVRKDPLKVIRAGISIVPYYSSSAKIGRKRYIDGAVAEPIGLRKLMKRYPHHKIIVIINYWKFRAYWQGLKTFLESFIVKRMYKKPIFKLFIKGDKRLWKDISLAEKRRRVLLIHPPKNNPSLQWTTDHNKLMTTYKMGIKEAQKVKKFLKI